MAVKSTASTVITPIVMASSSDAVAPLVSACSIPSSSNDAVIQVAGKAIAQVSSTKTGDLGLDLLRATQKQIIEFCKSWDTQEKFNASDVSRLNGLSTLCENWAVRLLKLPKKDRVNFWQSVKERYTAHIVALLEGVPEKLRSVVEGEIAGTVQDFTLNEFCSMFTEDSADFPKFLKIFQRDWKLSTEEIIDHFEKLKRDAQTIIKACKRTDASSEGQAGFIQDQLTNARATIDGCNKCLQFIEVSQLEERVELSYLGHREFNPIGDSSGINFCHYSRELARGILIGAKTFDFAITQNAFAWGMRETNTWQHSWLRMTIAAICAFIPALFSLGLFSLRVPFAIVIVCFLCSIQSLVLFYRPWKRERANLENMNRFLERNSTKIIDLVQRSSLIDKAFLVTLNELCTHWASRLIAGINFNTPETSKKLVKEYRRLSAKLIEKAKENKDKKRTGEAEIAALRTTIDEAFLQSIVEKFTNFYSEQEILAPGSSSLKNMKSFLKQWALGKEDDWRKKIDEAFVKERALTDVRIAEDIKLVSHFADPKTADERICRDDYLKRIRESSITLRVIQRCRNVLSRMKLTQSPLNQEPAISLAKPKTSKVEPLLNSDGSLAHTRTVPAAQTASVASSIPINFNVSSEEERRARWEREIRGVPDQIERLVDYWEQYLGKGDRAAIARSIISNPESMEMRRIAQAWRRANGILKHPDFLIRAS